MMKYLISDEKPMNIASLGLHITDRCNAKCLHCAFSCSPESDISMGLREAKIYVADAKALDAEIVCITGGEPMLFPDLVEKIIIECSRLSFPEIWMFTNGYWANNLAKTFRIAKKLGSLGLTKIFTSVDYFHQIYVPVESVKNLIEASLEAGLNVCVDARFIGDPYEENKFNLATHSYLKVLGNFLSRVDVVKAQPMFVGRAAESLIKHVKKKPLSEILKEECPGAWAGGTLASPSGVDIDEFGFVSICPELNIGNTKKTTLAEIIEKYNYKNHIVIAALYDGGINGLMDVAFEKGFIPRKSYANGCHFCYDARKFLDEIK